MSTLVSLIINTCFRLLLFYGINSSQVDVAMRFRCGEILIVLSLSWKFNAKSVGERSLKIG